MKERLSHISVHAALILFLALPCFLSGCRFRARARVNTQSASLANNVQGGGVGLATTGLTVRVHIVARKGRAMRIRVARAKRSAVAMRQQAAAAAESAAECARQAAREEIEKMEKGDKSEDSPPDPPQSPS
ncbi:MAG: hypothetical protein GXP25_05555 [Planctomycetes bacterium]|nr:hypothetical protein [Planctomycetota bacterium]